MSIYISIFFLYFSNMKITNSRFFFTVHHIFLNKC